MALSSLFDDFPLFRYDNGSPRRRRPARPLLYSMLDSLEDQIGQKVGQVFRILPHLTMELDDVYENSGVGKKRKVRSGSVAGYEPKSKVVVSDKENKFKILLDTSNFQPDEISVKVVNDKLAISAKHEAKEKDVYEFYEMYRSFDLPENVDANAIKSHLSASGQLSVEAPLKAVREPKERTIPVEIEGKEQQAVESNEQQAAEGNEQKAAEGNEQKADEGNEQKADEGNEQKSDEGKEQKNDEGKEHQAVEVKEQEAVEGSETTPAKE